MNTNYAQTAGITTQCKSHHEHGMHMQQPITACTRARTLTSSELALVLPVFGCCILLQLVPKIVLILCNLRWWCYIYIYIYIYKVYMNVAWEVQMHESK